MYIITKWTESVDFTLHLRGEHSMIINYKLQIEHIKKGSIINVGVTPLRCHFQHYFFAKK